MQMILAMVKRNTCNEDYGRTFKQVKNKMVTMTKEYRHILFLDANTSGGSGWLNSSEAEKKLRLYDAHSGKQKHGTTLLANSRQLKAAMDGLLGGKPTATPSLLLSTGGELFAVSHVTNFARRTCRLTRLNRCVACSALLRQCVRQMHVLMHAIDACKN